MWAAFVRQFAAYAITRRGKKLFALIGVLALCFGAALLVDLQLYLSAGFTAMLAGYAASDAVCRPVMRELLETDERFTIGAPVEVEQKASTLFAPPPTIDPKELEAKREQRRAAKDAKKLAEKKAKEARAAAQAARRSALHKSKRKG